jgi:diguanylate cyclase (GGDEF)-like protein/PAS domain S-box-containing protein
LVRLVAAILFWIISTCFIAAPAMSLEAINVPIDTPALDLTNAIDRYINVGDRIQVSTAPGTDGIVRRIEVRARDQETSGNWVVFALSNTSDEQIDRLLVAPHFRRAGSKIIWPDLGASRMVYITPSQGFAPERQESQEADVFLITLDPGAIVTFVAELRTEELPQLYLWEPDAYKDNINATTLYKGIVIGIAGLLALFLSILFIVKSSAMFPAVAGLAWAVLMYLSIEFGFFNRLFDLKPGQEQIYRAVTEVAVAAGFVIFLFAYLNLNRWHVRFSHIAIVWLGILAALLGISIIEPSVAAGIARICFGLVGVLGFALIVTLALRGFDRAVLLLPTWIIFIAWLTGAGLAISGNLVNDLVSPALAGGLVLIVLLIGFTVMQHAFSSGVLSENFMNDSERKVLALAGSGDIVWDWDVTRDRIYTSQEAETLLGLKHGTLEGPAMDWLEFLHPSDRDTFRGLLDAMLEQKRGRIDQAFRLRTQEGSYCWLRLRARPVVGNNGEVFRCVGTLLDVTEAKLAEERLLHDAVHDNLTGLANRELFIDRLDAAIKRAKAERLGRPSILTVDLDSFKQINEEIGLSVGDSVLLTVARRISRLLKPQDSLARIAGDEFAILLISEQDPAKIAAFAEAIRRAMHAPIIFGDREIFLTASVGIAVYDSQTERADDLLKDAEVAMVHAKKSGGDRTEAYKPSLRQNGRDVLAVESDLRKALEREELTVLYQPIVRLEDRSIAGFEALVRWDHPKRGRMSPGEFVPIAEKSGLIIPLGLYVLERAARNLGQWYREIPGADDVFVSVNVSSRQLLRHDLINDLKAVLTRADLPGKALKLEVTESLVMENPEYSAQVLSRIKALDVGLSLDDFGTGYSSLAYLQRFPFDTIKVDQSFVRGTGRGGNRRPVILRSIVTLAHDLGMTVIAEGAETESISLELQQFGCELAQGFLFGPAISAEEVRLLLNEQLQLVAE